MNRRRFLAGLIASPLFVSAGRAAPSSGWRLGPRLTTAAIFGRLVPLPDGGALIVRSSNPGAEVPALAERVHPNEPNGLDTALSSIFEAGFDVLQLAGGDVLAAGPAQRDTPRAQVYESAAGRWTALPPPPPDVCRGDDSVQLARLPGGMALLLSTGLGDGDAVSSSAVVWDPGRFTWETVSPAPGPLSFGPLAALPDGRVLRFGGLVPGGSVWDRRVDAFDPATRTWALWGESRWGGPVWLALTAQDGVIALARRQVVHIETGGRVTRFGVGRMNTACALDEEGRVIFRGGLTGTIGPPHRAAFRPCAGPEDRRAPRPSNVARSVRDRIAVSLEERSPPPGGRSRRHARLDDGHMDPRPATRNEVNPLQVRRTERISITKEQGTRFDDHQGPA